MIDQVLIQVVSVRDQSDDNEMISDVNQVFVRILTNVYSLSGL